MRDSWKPISELVEDIKSGKTTATELVQRALKNCEADEHNALISINSNALEEARKIDERIKQGELTGDLLGIPYIAKDNYLTKGVTTTAASNMLKDYVPPINAVAVQKLENAGAILVAKANLDSFAHGASTENSDMGVTLNPHDTTKVPGGSSGGSAVATLQGLAPFSLGSDTGGSIRLPASFTGTVGYKPTYGLVSRYGVVAMASSTDVMGPITTNVADAGLVLEVLSGRDEMDSTTIEKDPAGYIVDKNTSLKGKKIGVIKEYMTEGVDTHVRENIESAIVKAEQAGASVEEVSIPELEYSLAVYYVVMPAEVSSNLSRFDGIRYGHSVENAKNLEEQYILNRSQGFNDEVKRRIMMGTYVLSSGYYDAYYKKAQQVRTLLIERFTSLFESFDFLIGPVSPTTAFKIGENSDDPVKMYLADVMTVAVSLVGAPAISIPSGKDSDGMPIGLQIIADARHDRQLLNSAQQFENILKYSEDLK